MTEEEQIEILQKMYVASRWGWSEDEYNAIKAGVAHPLNRAILNWTYSIAQEMALDLRRKGLEIRWNGWPPIMDMEDSGDDT